MSKRNNRIGSSSIVNLVSSDIKISRISAENSIVEKDNNTTSEEFPGFKFNFNCSQSFYHKILRWLMLRISGKSRERLIFETGVYYFNIGSYWRAHWRATFRAPLPIPNAMDEKCGVSPHLSPPNG